jgi:Ca2+-binding EF-hand superfamily protein
MSLPLLRRKETPGRKGRRRRRDRTNTKKKLPVAISVGDLLRIEESRGVGKLLDILTEKCLSKIAKSSSGGAREMFLLFLTEGKGGNEVGINFASFKSGCKRLSLGFSEKEIAIAFRKIDGDGNGSIDFEEFANLILSHHTHILRTIDYQAKGQLRNTQLQMLNKLRQRGAGRSKGSHGAVHGHRVNVATLQQKLKQTIWEWAKGDANLLRQLFRHFQDTLQRNGVTFQSFIHGLQACECNMSPQDQWALFNACDRKGNGLLNFKQFRSDYTTRRRPTDRRHSNAAMNNELEKYLEKTRSEHVKKHSIPSLSSSRLRPNQTLSVGSDSTASFTSRTSRKTAPFAMPKLRRTWDMDKSETLYSVKSSPFCSRCR